MATAKKSARGKRSGAKQKTIVPPTRQIGLESATGIQLAHEAGKEIPKGKDRGSTLEIVGGEPEADALEGSKPSGKQAEPAQFVSNGSLEPNMVGSPTGAVPVAAVASSPEHAEQLVQEHEDAHAAYVERRAGNKRLDPNTVHRMGRAELAAIGHQRGYALPQAGTRGTRHSFLKAQDADKSLS